eukprot:366284-Chlamydomonas_euryale.AAC.2
MLCKKNISRFLREGVKDGLQGHGCVGGRGCAREGARAKQGCATVSGGREWAWAAEGRGQQSHER